MIFLTHTVWRQDRLLTARVHDEEVMLDIDQGAYFALNPLGARIWELLAKPFCVEAICEQLQAEYEVSREQCEREVLEFLNNLSEKKLIFVAEHA